MAYVVKEGSNLCSLFLCVCYFNPFALQYFKRLVHKIHGAQRVVKTGMDGTRVDKLCKTQLPDMAHALEKRMLHQIKDGIAFDWDKPVNGIINDLILVQSVLIVKALTYSAFIINL